MPSGFKGSSGFQGTPRNRLPPIGSLNRRIILCTAKDVSDDGGSLRLIRERAMTTWAAIKERRGSQFGRDGQVIKDTRDQASHDITIRICEGVEISSAAWAFEHRTRLSPRWFKILTVEEFGEIGQTGRFWKLGCRLVERDDDVSRPTAPEADCPTPTFAAPLPDGVKL